MIMFIFFVKTKFRIFIQNFIDFNLAFQMLKIQYDIIDLITLNVSIQKLCRINMFDKNEIIQYATHMKHHINKLRQIQCEFFVNFIDFLFRMNLSTNLNFYVFQLIHSIKFRNVEFIIDDMIVALMNQKKRFIYVEKTSTTNVIRKIA